MRPPDVMETLVDCPVNGCGSQFEMGYRIFVRGRGREVAFEVMSSPVPRITVHLQDDHGLAVKS